MLRFAIWGSLQIRRLCFCGVSVKHPRGLGIVKAQAVLRHSGRYIFAAEQKQSNAEIPPDR